jgi:hypothetical protein
MMVPGVAAVGAIGFILHIVDECLVLPSEGTRLIAVDVELLGIIILTLDRSFIGKDDRDLVPRCRVDVGGWEGKENFFKASCWSGDHLRSDLFEWQIGNLEIPHRCSDLV